MSFFSNMALRSANKKIIKDIQRTNRIDERGMVNGDDIAYGNWQIPGGIKDRDGGRWFHIGIKKSSSEPPKVYVWSSAKNLTEITGKIVSCCYNNGLSPITNPGMYCRMLLNDGVFGVFLTFMPADKLLIPSGLFTALGLREVTAYIDGKEEVILTYDQAKKKLVRINELNKAQE